LKAAPLLAKFINAFYASFNRVCLLLLVCLLLSRKLPISKPKTKRENECSYSDSAGPNYCNSMTVTRAHPSNENGANTADCFADSLVSRESAYVMNGRELARGLILTFAIGLAIGVILSFALH
jgi:hypothetical protein